MTENSNDANEEWQPVAGFEGLYEVSSFGRIAIPAGFKRYKRPLSSDRFVMSPCNSKMGYLRVTLCKDSKKYSLRIHSIVAAAFLGNLPEGFTVNHIDAKKHNNNVNNLEIISNTANVKHAVDLGLTAKGEINGQCITTEAAVIAIRADKTSSRRALAEKYGMSPGNVGNIVLRRSWKHVA